MMRKLIFWLLWIGLILYAFIFAPPDQPDTLPLIINLSTGNLTGINPLITALFNLMGIWPIIYSCVLFIDGRGQKIPAGIFAGLSFAVGAFAILPYLGLREINPTFFGEKNIFLRVLDSRWTAFLLSLVALILLIYGLTQGNGIDFVQQWQNSRFIHVMTLDFFLLSFIFPSLLIDDMKRRQMTQQKLFLSLAFIPLIGALIYLCFRPPLPNKISTEI